MRRASIGSPGGVFNNPWEIIATSMAKALQMLDDASCPKKGFRKDLAVIQKHANRDHRKHHFTQ